ncbi:MAG: class I SAM-dependent methyltransferase [Candidatus Thioglobus sp.]|nr:class I SAM-dependent methyltransferase [Candidatus Thioglobus pontius]MBL6985133.1 class I SAM-dependent methyltransferase [Candidatus Thioglobus sp.]
MTQDQSCPLCGSNKTQSYYSNENSSYLQCSNCELVFLAKRFHLNDTDEKSRYDLHQNTEDNTGYQQFLSTVFDPVLKHIQPQAKGLDFGCGPGPTLSKMFENQGYKVDLFDKYYANDQQVFSQKYDFITATEVWEHLSNPGVEIERLFSMLNANGVLAVMTQQLTNEVDFSTWYYKNDPTHICFFSKKTFEFLAEKYQAKFGVVSDNSVLFFPSQ